MYVDAQTTLWDAAALTADAVSTNAYDMGVDTRDVGIGEPLSAVITVDVAADATTGDETYRFDLIQSTVTALTSPDLLASHIVTAAQATAGALAAGTIVVIPVPMGRITKRYLGLQFDGGGTSPTITVTAWITLTSMVSVPKKHPDGITITG
jgi:hypothetical protein